jgi:AcrR family transcriptional regulator
MADRATRKKQITERRQAQILQAAGEIFTQKGYAAATVPEIARLAGLASGTVYLYFPSKRDLFIATIQQLMTLPLAHIIDHEAGGNMSQILNGVIANRLELLQRDSFPSFISMMGEIQRDEELKAIFVRKTIKPFLTYMEGMYQERITSSEFRKMEPEVIVRLIGGIFIGLGILRILEGDSSPVNHMPKEKLASEIRDFILFGISGGNEKKEQKK